MILRHRDRDILRFDWVEPFGVKNVERNSSNAQFLPLSFRDRVQGEDDRLAVIQYFVRKCISDLAAKRWKSTIYAEISGVRDTINAKGEAADANENSAARTTLAVRFGVSSATIARRFKTLQSAGAIRRVGSRKTGSWVVEQKEC